MAFWHSSPLLSDSIAGKAKLWPPSAYHNTYRVPQHSSEHFDARQCSVTRGAGTEWMKSGRFITNFWVLSPTPPVTWNRRDYYLSCPHFFRPYFARFILFPSHFLQTSAADFYIRRIIPIFCHSSDCIGKYLAKSSLTSMLFNTRTKFERSCFPHISSNTDGFCITFTFFTLHNIHNL